MLSQTTKFPGCILILKTINISQPCLLTQHWEFIATSCYNQQKLCTVRHCTIPWTRHCWLKSKQFCLSQNTPKRCILHSNTHCLVKNRATSQFVQNFSTFSSSRPSGFFLSLRTAKNHTLFSGLKKPQSIQQILVNNQKKTHTFRLLPVRVFFPLHC